MIPYRYHPDTFSSAWAERGNVPEKASTGKSVFRLKEGQPTTVHNAWERESQDSGKEGHYVKKSSVCIVALSVLLVIMLVGLVLAILAGQGYIGYQEPQELNSFVGYSLKSALGRQYTTDLSDNSTQDYQLLSKAFCDQMEDTFSISVFAKQYQGCTVTAFREKSTQQTDVAYKLVFENLSESNLITPPKSSSITDPAIYTLEQIVEDLAPTFVTDYIGDSTEIEQELGATDMVELLDIFEQQEINHCESNSCSNGATCVDGLTRHICSCPTGFTGSECQTMMDDFCWLADPPLSCDETSAYRTYDGTCNNLANRNWGRAIQPLERLLSPAYDADSDTRSRGKNGQELPSPRKISTTLFHQATAADVDSRLTHMHMLWGQFIDHDFSRTPMTPKVTCCGIPAAQQSEDCIPIAIPSDDPFYGSQGRLCMELRRSMALTSGQCGMAQREQLNNLTSYIDGGLVYGSSEQEAIALRALTEGQLLTSTGDLLPDSDTISCDIPQQHGHTDRRCFIAGDSRVNVWAGLTSIHTAFVRQHNVVAKSLYNSLPTPMSEAARDETAYQEAKRIITAMLQVITYKEYLPNVLGAAVMSENSLNLGATSDVYNPNLNAGTTNVFATAAFRFGHGEIMSNTQPKDSSYNDASTVVNMVETFNQPAALRYLGQDNVLRGVCVEPSLSMTRSFSSEVRDTLFARSFNGLGLDLPAVNIQRGRDHGLPPYNDWRNFCGLSKGAMFSNLPDIPDVARAQLELVYDHPDDIDIFAGAMVEGLIAEDAHVGPTFACLLALQFKRLKEGDRFWFENQLSYPNPFTQTQIDQLRNITLSRVICDTTDSTTVPENVFKLNSTLINCSDVPNLDLSNWL